MPSIGTARVPHARRQQILDYLDQNGSAAVGQLAARLGVSLATVHRDLRILEDESALQRVQGGATVVTRSGKDGTYIPEYIDSPWAERLRSNVEAKLAIGFRALDLIDRGDTVINDASTTGLALAAAIETADIPITIVTTSPAIVQTLTSPTVKLVVVPGQVDQELRIITGSWSTEFLEHFNFTHAFISCAGISEEGSLYTESRDIQVTLQTALRRSTHKVCLLDASKFNRLASLLLCAAEDLDAFVLGAPLSAESEARIARHGVEVLNANVGLPPRLENSLIYQTYFAATPVT